VLPDTTFEKGNAMDAIEKLKAVLCDPSGDVCCRGSDGDRTIIAEALGELAELGHEFGVEHRLYLQCKHDLASANDAMRDVFPVAHTLAHVLACLLMDTKDMATVSKWWDSAQEAIEQWREFCREDDKKTMNCDRSACGDFSPGRCDNPDCPALVTPNV
jgi:hypothetical protein